MSRRNSSDDFPFYLIIMWWLIIMMIISSCKQEVHEPYYKIDQKVYSVNGKDSVETNVFWYKNSEYIGHGVLTNKSAIKHRTRDSIQAQNFIRTHKQFN